MAPARDHSATVLCVDDDEEVLTLVTEHLSQVGLNPEPFTDPEAVVSRAGDPDVACVVSDYAMPGMSGLELLEAVRRRRPNLPFVLFTGQGSETLASEALDAGVTDYVLKDTDHAYVRLRDRIGRAVGEARADRTRRRYSKLLGASDEVVVVLSPDGEILDVSESVERVFGYSTDEVVGTHFESYLRPREAPEVDEHLENVAIGAASAERLELGIRRADDQWVTVEAWAKDFVSDPDVGGVVVYLRDVTERADREAWVRALIENSTDVTSVLDMDGTVRYKGGSSRKVFGYGPEDIVGDRIHQYIHPEDLTRLEEVFEPIVDSPGTVAGPETYRFDGPGGEWRWVESVLSHPETEAVSGLVVNTRGVGERVERERRLRLVESIVESMQDAAWTVDEDLELTYVNQQLAERMDTSADELVGRSVTEATLAIAHPDETERYVSMLRAILDGEVQSRREQFTVELPDGDRQIEVQANAITPPDGGETDDGLAPPDGVVCVSRDVTDRVESERRLERQNERLELLNHIVRHDIHNDMTIISGWLTLLREDVDDDVAERFDDVVRASDHVMELLQGVGEALTVLGSDEGISVKPTPVDEALENEVARVRDVHPDAEVRLPDELPGTTVRANEMLASVFRNLLVNGITHAETDEPTVVVDTEVTDGRVCVSVADEGPGLSASLREALIDPEQSVAEVSGVGVGLYLVETLVSAYDGDIEIRDNEPTGTVFTVSLKRMDGETDTVAGVEAEATSDPDGD